MTVELIAFDIGGAHLKAAAINSEGLIVATALVPCPLWQGLDQLFQALDQVISGLCSPADCRHAVTMTGELADFFPDRETGVLALAEAVTNRLAPASVSVFAGYAGLLPAAKITVADTGQIASANWLASGFWLASVCRDAVFMDIGSTTTDILRISDHKPNFRGYTDHERMRYDELIYSGVVRTPLMALTDRAPVKGNWTTLMAEHFATTADVYRLTGELSEHADQYAAADGGAKTIEGSCRRLSRMFGLDATFLPVEGWRSAARFFREKQLVRLREALDLQRSLDVQGQVPVLIGAGVGRFLVQEMANRMNLEYLSFSSLIPMGKQINEYNIADCAPAAALACLAHKEMHPG